MNNLLIFDGDCAFCHWASVWFAKKDSKDLFRFTTADSSIGKSVIEKFNIAHLTDKTVIVIADERYYTKSKAIAKFLEITQKMILLRIVFWLIPTFIADLGYDLIARYRKRLIQEKCEIPNEEIKRKFIR